MTPFAPPKKKSDTIKSPGLGASSETGKASRSTGVAVAGHRRAAEARDEQAGERHGDQRAERHGEERDAERGMADLEAFLEEWNLRRPGAHDNAVDEEDRRHRPAGARDCGGRVLALAVSWSVKFGGRRPRELCPQSWRRSTGLKVSPIDDA